MAGLYFKSIRSGSSGNCLMLWTEQTTVLIDCGISSGATCEELIHEHIGSPDRINAVVVSHIHHDHISYGSLRVFSRYGVPVRCHEHCLPDLRTLYAGKACEHGLRIRTFSDKPFRVGQFIFRPVSIPHQPRTRNFGFVIYCRLRGVRRKVVIMTDFHDWKGLLDHFIDADFIFIESNHDPLLLRKHPNYNSRFHLKNEKAAWLLYHARKQSRFGPQAVMLGHLSEKRNTRELALDTFHTVFEKNRIPRDFEVLAAERDQASPIVKIAG